jgi:hypothetical protein
MNTNSTYVDQSVIQSKLSFRPLIRVWETIIREGREGSKGIYRELLDKVKQHPELLENITDESILKKHQDLIEQMMTTIFPVTLSDDNDLYGVSIPFQYKMIYSSKLFRSLFLGETGDQICVPENKTGQRLSDEKLAGAYQMILARLYNFNVDGLVSTVHPYQCPFTALDKYMELELDTRFIDVKVKGELPQVPADWEYDYNNINDIMRIPNLCEVLPLNLFEFEGMVIIRIKEVTQREVLNIIRDRLLDIHTFSDANVFHDLQTQVQNLMGVPGIQTAIKPFFRVNNHLIQTEIHTTFDLGVKEMPTVEKMQQIYQAALATFKENGGSVLVINEINEEAVSKYPFLVMLYKFGWKNAIICPLFTDNKEDLLGVILLVSPSPGKLTRAHIGRIEPAIPLFKVAIEKSQENLDTQVERVIKEQFTAVQDAVEWRFTEAALKYLTSKNKGDQAKIEPIVFEGVYPLYGAIDIRNSSIERNNAIQLDLLEQLNLANEIIILAKEQNSFPLLDETVFKIQKYIHSVSNILFADE